MAKMNPTIDLVVAASVAKTAEFTLKKYLLEIKFLEKDKEKLIDCLKEALILHPDNEKWRKLIEQLEFKIVLKTPKAPPEQE